MLSPSAPQALGPLAPQPLSRSAPRLLFILVISCLALKTPAQKPTATKRIWNVGVLGNARNGQTLADFLTEAVGPQFEPNITFIYVPFSSLAATLPMVENGEVDFVYTVPTQLSCVMAEFSAVPLATRRYYRNGFPATRYGSVMYTQAGNDQINAIADIRDMRVVCSSIGGTGACQLPWKEIEDNGYSLMNDPKQILFSGGQANSAHAVKDGHADVGFATASYFEEAELDEDSIIEASAYKVFNQKTIFFEGQQMPFEISTPLYPEWTVAALPNVDAILQRKVQETLYLVTPNSTFAQSLRVAGWEPPPSHSIVRDLQTSIGTMIWEEDTGIHRCLRQSSDIYEAITCPTGFFKKSRTDVDEGCENAGIVCPEGFTCLCRPCKKSDEIEVVTWNSDGSGDACSKMEICVQTRQNEIASFAVRDNTQSLSTTEVTIITSMNGGPFTEFKAAQSSEADEVGTYYFNFTTQFRGQALIQVVWGEQQVLASPFLIRVEDGLCPDSSLREPSEDGECVCKSYTVEIGNRCTRLAVLIPSIILPIVFVAAIFLLLWIQRYKARNDSVWRIGLDELDFGVKPDILGRGSFGLVVRALYRGTPVAVKRAIPASTQGKLKHIFEGDKLESDEASAASNSSAQGSSGHTGSQGVVGSTSSTNLPLRGKQGSGSVVASSADLPRSETGQSDRHNSQAGSQGSPPGGSIRTGDSLQGVPPISPGVQSGQKYSGSGGPDKWKRAPSFGSNRHHSNSDGIGSLNGQKSPMGRRTRENTSGGRKKRSGFASKVSTFTSTAFGSGPQSRKKMLAKFIDEMRFLSKMRHPCITTVMGAVIQNGEEPMLVMELMVHGSLYDLVTNTTVALETDMVLPILGDVVQGMYFLHSAKDPIIHGDLKAQNILVDSNFRAKVADFGLTQKRSLGFVGTPYWMPPEVLNGEPPTAAADVYAFGVVLFQALARKDPYEGEEYDKVIEALMDDTMDPPKNPGVPQGDCPLAVQSLMQECWHRQPSCRPTFQEIERRVSAIEASGVTVKALNMIARQKQEADQANDVLFDVFPRHVAEALIQGKQPEPDTREAVTIFFSDIVGFTNISSTLDPEKVSQMLHRLYTKFDSLSLAHEVFKVETIGDAYMAVTNLVKDQADHTARIARFAMEAIKAANETLIDETDESKGTVQIRVGFHTGPVVAHVVGLRNPRYCLFGDTVNTSSRMESNSLAGRIHCSLPSAQQIKAQDSSIRLESRGVIEVKGKGKMRTFWVLTEGQDTFGTEGPEPGFSFKDSGSGSFKGSSSMKNRGDASVKGKRELPPTVSRVHSSPVGQSPHTVHQSPIYANGKPEAASAALDDGQEHSRNGASVPSQPAGTQQDSFQIASKTQNQHNDTQPNGGKEDSVAQQAKLSLSRAPAPEISAEVGHLSPNLRPGGSGLKPSPVPTRE